MNKDNQGLQLIWGLIVFGLAACSPRSEVPAAVEAGEIANWGAWRITFMGAQTYVDVTVEFGEDQETFLPEKAKDVFMAARAEMVNISRDTQEMRFAQGPIYLTGRDGEVHDLVGIAHKDTILMAPPYLLVEKTLFTSSKWEGGFYTLAYQPDAEAWFIQATSGARFNVDFLFTIPASTSGGLVLQFGNGLTVNIH